MDIVVLGIDLRENSCSLAGLDASGRVILRRRMRRSSAESFVKGLGRCIVAMEACCGAPQLGRVFACQGAANASDVAGMTGHGGMARTDATPDDDRRQAAPARHQRARQLAGNTTRDRIR